MFRTAMVSEESKQTPPPQNPKRPPIQQSDSSPIQNANSVFSPRFKSVVAMAGWDEEALLLASFIVEDTPDRESKHKKRFAVPIKSPPQSSRRKRRAQRRSIVPAPVIALNLDDEETVNQEATVCEEKKTELDTASIEETKEVKLGDQSSCVSSSNSALPCMDKLKEELSCAICLEICYEPSTTPCGHSFCKKCLRSAADKCGKKCPKCRQLIRERDGLFYNGRSCTVNTVLWNTIQLLFPQEIEARKQAAAGTSNIRETDHKSALHSDLQDQSIRIYRTSSRVAPRRDTRSMRSSEESARRRRRGIPIQNEDAALALRLQREEFMEAFRGTSDSTTSAARANLRAMASRALSLHVRGRPM